MSVEEQDTASSDPRWTRDSFIERSGIDVTIDDWKLISPILEKAEFDDEQWKSAVAMARMARQKAQELAEKDKEIAQKDKEIAQKIAQKDKEIEELKARADRDESNRYLVLSVSEASKDPHTRKDFREKQLAEEPCRGGFIAQKFYLDFVLAAREFEKFGVFEEKDNVVDQVAELGKILKNRVDHTLFNAEFIKEEAPQSALGSEMFRQAIDLLQPDQSNERQAPRLRVTHQQNLVTSLERTDGTPFKILGKKRKSEKGSEGEPKKSTGKIDICIWFVHQDSSLGACVLAACEYKPSNAAEQIRKAEADMYGSNIVVLHQKPCIVIDIAGGNDLKKWTVSAYGLVKAEFTGKTQMEKSPLYVGHGAEAIVMVARGLLEAIKSFPNALNQLGSRLGPVVGEIDGFVYKVYDNAKHRKPNIDAVKQLLDNDAELMSSKDDELKILKMKRMESNWKQKVSSQVFQKIIQKLSELHKDYGPHGDIRLANLLSSGHIIDFDFVKAEKYPSTYNLIHQDGQRHADVVKMIENIEQGAGDEELIEPKKIHDWFSLGRVMRLFRPIEDSDVASWTTVCEKVEKGEVPAGPDFPSYAIELKDRDIPLKGTGNTPIKKQPGAIAEEQDEQAGSEQQKRLKTN